eukprot:m.92950 g.92950  ORF g.92950 m.92950 type:complete len:388 (-) comp51188_c0_seq4:62-1225(-)
MSSPALERLAIRRSSITTTTDVPAASPTVSRRVKEYEDAEKPQPFGRKTQITHVIIPAARLAEIPRKRSQVACLPRSRVGLQAEQAGTATSRSLGQILVSPLGSLLTGETARVSTWIQLAGHKGDFVTGHPGTICKKSSDMEKTAFEALMNDILKSFVPFYFREMTAESVSYLELQDLLVYFDNPCIMDVKMGIRTFLESEVGKNTRRMDLLEKMMAVDANEATDEEKELGISKLRYMQFRERESTTQSLGFRLEGIKLGAQETRSDFKKVKTVEEVGKMLSYYLPGRETALHDIVASRIVQRLFQLRETLQQSRFFQDFELIGTSILFIYDHTGHAGLWMIDFGKSTKVDVPITHDQPWVLGNREDGYLTGLNNLIKFFKEELDGS